MTRGGQGLARVAVVVRAGAAPLWWLGVVAAGAGAFVPGLTGLRIGALGGAALFLGAAAVVALTRRGRYRALARAAARAGRNDVLQDRAVTARNWRRAHRWWLLLAGCGAGLWLKAAWLGRLERADEVLLWVRVDWLRKGAGRPAGRAVKAFRTTGIAAGDAAPGGARRRLVKAA